MTAEIAILNKNGVVLAADSAVTISSNSGRDKAYNAANKLFSLGVNKNISFMIYGNSKYMGIPWEIIFKEFRNETKTYTFENVETCAKKFFKFLNKKQFNDDEIAKAIVVETFYKALDYITNSASGLINEEQAKRDNHEIENGKIIEILKKRILYIREHNINRKLITFKMKEKVFLSEFVDFIEKDLKSYFKIDINNIFNELVTLLYELVIYENSFDSPSGIVFAGYGKNDLFPSLYSYEVDYSFKNQLKYISKESTNITLKGCSASIIPFAQSDMILTILKGMDPSLHTEIVDKISDSELTDEQKRDIIKSVASFQRKNFIDPILNIVSMLSVSELANMAETLVNLTSFKRHITDSLETVGGPVDVLVITRGDGPIWINRKEYFDLQKNLDYQLRKRGTRDGSN